MAVADPRIESQRPGRGHLFQTGIHSEDTPASRRDRGGQRPVAATEIEDVIVGSGGEHLDQRSRQIGHEAAVLGVAGGIPALRLRGIRLAVGRAILWRLRPHCRSG